jgi:hypothetical protein
MLINREVFSLPPYISTSWGHVTALFMLEDVLVVSLNDGSNIHIPRLAQALLERIFTAHASHLEEQSKREEQAGETNSHLFEMPLRMSFSQLEGLSTALQHNFEQSDTPDLPPEMLHKISSIAKIAGLHDPQQLPKPEPHCNCVHCQIARAMQSSLQDEDENEEATPVTTTAIPSVEKIPAVTENDESSWLVEQNEDQLYTVTHRNNESLNYKVYLGSEQVGCNCGIHGCEHILAVLRS